MLHATQTNKSTGTLPGTIKNESSSMTSNVKTRHSGTSVATAWGKKPETWGLDLRMKLTEESRAKKERFQRY